MHKLVTTATFLAVLVLAVVVFNNAVSSQQLAAAAASYSAPEYRIDEIKATELELTAPAFAVFDIDTGEILVSVNEKESLPIASVTKLITSAAVMSGLDLDQSVTIVYKDVATEGESGKLSVGQEYTYHELLFPMLLESSNDAAAVFERVTEGGVVDRMNTLVQKIGAKDTVFTDASGLSSGNISSVADLALITSHLYTGQPHIFDVSKLSQYVGPYTGWVNNSPVANEDGYAGGKHGYTHAANRTIVSVFTEDFGSETKDIGYIVLGSDDLKTDISTLRTFVSESINFE